MSEPLNQLFADLHSVRLQPRLANLRPGCPARLDSGSSKSPSERV